MNQSIPNPIEGFFISSKEKMIFDVKGISHPDDRVIAFVRYIPVKYFELAKTDSPTGYRKLYDLDERYAFLKKKFPDYLFDDPKGRGSLQGVLKDRIQTIYNPLLKMKGLVEEDLQKSDKLEKLALELATQIEEYSNVKLENIGISGSILVELHNEKSDIDLVVYGRKNGQAIYQNMPEIFDSCFKVNRYSKTELKSLWNQRGQQNQIDYNLFYNLEKDKQLQGTISSRDFYTRLVLLPDEYYEPYQHTEIRSLGELEIEATIANDELSIFTPCIYYLKEIKIKTKSKTIDCIPNRIFSVRGRYADIAKENDKVNVRGKLEAVKINGKREYYQLTLGTLKNEFFLKI